MCFGGFYDVWVHHKGNTLTGWISNIVYLNIGAIICLIEWSFCSAGEKKAFVHECVWIDFFQMYMYNLHF